MDLNFDTLARESTSIDPDNFIFSSLNPQILPALEQIIPTQLFLLPKHGGVEGVQVERAPESSFRLSLNFKRAFAASDEEDAL